MNKIFRFAYVVLIYVFLAACATFPNTQSQMPVELMDLSKQDFGFEGKMSFSDGNEGGSGQVNWQRSGQVIEVVLKAPLSKKSWTLTADNNFSTIRTSTGETFHDVSAAGLVSDQVGWDVPWEALQSWVMGRPTISGQLEWRNDEQGYLIVEQGWVIQYSKLKPYEGGLLPHKIVARKQPYSIKLSIKSWQQ